MGPHTPQYGYVGEQKKKLPPASIALIVGVLLLVILAIVVIASLLNKDSLGTQSAHLSARLGNLSTLTAAAPKQLSNGTLKKINAETSIITDGAQANLASILPKKVDKSIQSDESDATDTSKLASAALAGTYDAEYKQVLTQKLESITALLNEMYGKAKSKTTRASLSDDYKNYSALLANVQKITP